MNPFETAMTQKDSEGNIVQFNHLEVPFRLDTGSAALTASEGPGLSARELADQYLLQAIPHFGLSPGLLSDDVGAEGLEQDSGERLEFESEKSIMGNSTVSYSQTLNGIPVWESGLVVEVEEASLQVIGAQSSVRRGIELAIPADDESLDERNITPEFLSECLRYNDGTEVNVNHTKKFVYIFRTEDRSPIPHEHPFDETYSEEVLLTPLPSEIVDGAAYLAIAVQFTTRSTAAGEEGWLALIEPKTSSVLYLRSLAGCYAHAEAQTMPTNIVLSDRDESGGAPATPPVCFFDIGDTLGRPVISPGNELVAIQIFPNILEILKELSEKKIRIGIISDPGPFNPDLITSLLQDTGIFEFVDQRMVHYGSKSNTVIFLEAATSAEVATDTCVFVGESQAERSVAQEAGFEVAANPNDVFGLVIPDAAIAFVFLKDPFTKLGPAGPAPTASSSALNPLRDLVTLRGLNSPVNNQNQRLVGEYVSLEEVDLPSPTIPSSPLPGDFRYSVTTNDFGAVNAYHNCDRLFRILEDFGIDPRQYFDGTNFPVRVDHRVRYDGRSNIVNASAPGFRFPQPRSDGFRFALAAENTAVNMASAWRVVLHEFGHACLWDQVGSPNFRFAHSFGDGAAAILNDPGNRASRIQTFPWVRIRRSHMRPVTDYAWYGTRYNPFRSGDRAGYIAEQMLSSTLFRIYRAAGGDSTNREEQEFAAHYVVFLTIKAVGLMTFANNPDRPEGFADLMMQADTGIFRYRNQSVPVGTLRKVIRWGFEKQGAYRLPPSFGQQPTNQEGNPPQVDVFINDGRDGEYDFLPSTNSVSIWNRRSDDNGTVHQPPLVGSENFAYVRVSNRGLSSANDVTVEAFQSQLDVGQSWPNDFQPLSTSNLTIPDSIPSGNDIVIGPFRWLPVSSTPTLLMSVSASGDQSGLRRFGTANAIEVSRIVPMDNNIAQRSMLAATP